MTLKYATTLNLAETLGIKKSIPSWAIAAKPINEAVGTGDSSQTQFYLDQQNIIADTYVLYANAVEMTETTHYTLDKITGEIILTADGVTMLSTNALTAKYSYFDNGMSDSYVSSILERAEEEIDSKINSVFTDGTSTNPSYPVETEYKSSEGLNRDRYIINKKPMIDIESTLDGDVINSQNTIDLNAGDGSKFPTSGYIIVESEVMSYTGISTDQLTGVSRGALGTTAATHSDGDAVHSTIFFVSDTDEGTAVSWTIQPWDTSMYAMEEGLFYRYLDSDPDPLTRRGVANRIKIIYYYGYDTVPVDITRLTLLFAKRMLIQDNISKAMIAGRDEFNPEMFNADKEEIERIINSYLVLNMGNT